MTAARVGQPANRRDPAPAARLAPGLLERPAAPPAGKRPGVAQAPAPRPGSLPTARDPAALIAWWERRRGGRPLPALADLDLAALGDAAPDAVLLRCDKGGSVLGARRLAATTEAGPVEFLPMVTEWLLRCGAEAARRGSPLHETRSFPAARGTVTYDLMLLPLGGGAPPAEHVLGWLARR